MSTTNLLSRRDFLKLAAATLLGVGAASLGVDLSPAVAAPPRRLGRIAFHTVNVRGMPSLNSEIISKLHTNALVPLLGELTGDDPTAYNPLWYITPGGYIHSAYVQPVDEILQAPTTLQFPREGILGEVTVPVTIAYQKPSIYSGRGYFTYYETTHWVRSMVQNKPENSLFYRVYDDNIKRELYIPVQHMRIIPPEEVTPLSPAVALEQKHVVVALKEQMMYAYEYGMLVFQCKVATGKRFTETPTGSFRTFYKRGSRHMSGGDLAAAYDLPGVPWVTYITDSGVSFHGTFWHNDFGAPRSNGCINMVTQDAKWLYRWTMPEVPHDRRFLYLPGHGTRVEIYESFSPS
jgi:lipoprotein-anchoring transpeptidase ErfK/SrfK